MTIIFVLLLVVVGYFYFTDKGFHRSLNKTVKRLGYSIEDKINDIKDKIDE